MKKFCKKCGVETERYKNGACRPCDRAYHNTYRATHREQMRRLERASYFRHRKEKVAQHREYYAKNREKKLTWARAYRKANPEKNKKWQQDYRERYPEKIRKKHLRRKYGIDQEIYKIMLEAQKGLCHICGKPETRKLKETLASLAVDHCHTTRRIRKLLCHCCNVVLGLVKENPLVLRRAAQYLEEGDERNGGTNGEGI
jgi:NMD protein affecting ribosome stability and mRNA decay